MCYGSSIITYFKKVVKSESISICDVADIRAQIEIFPESRPYCSCLANLAKLILVLTAFLSWTYNYLSLISDSITHLQC